MARVLMHIEIGNVNFLNDIIRSIEVEDNLGDRLDTKKSKIEYEDYIDNIN